MSPVLFCLVFYKKLKSKHVFLLNQSKSRLLEGLVQSPTFCEKVQPPHGRSELLNAVECRISPTFTGQKIAGKIGANAIESTQVKIICSMTWKFVKLPKILINDFYLDMLQLCFIWISILKIHQNQPSWNEWVSFHVTVGRQILEWSMLRGDSIPADDTHICHILQF